MAQLDALAGSVIGLRSQVLGEQVLEQLRVLVITGELPVGTHLVESQLSNSFGVSRGPIRDALAQLEIEGLVESRRRGMFVRGLTTEDINELYSVREAIELMALKLAAAAPKERWDLSLDSLEQMRKAAAVGDHLTFARADMEFHATFYAIAQNRRLRKVWQQYEPTFAVLLKLTTAEDRDLGPSYDSHEELHRRMLGGDLAAAATLLEEHLLGSRARLVSAFSRMTSTEEPSDPTWKAPRA